MNKLLSYQYLDNSIKNSEWILLAFLHELRIATVSQLIQLMKQSNSIKPSTVYYKVKHLEDVNLIDYIFLEGTNNQKCYFLTRAGHQSIGGIYTLPRVANYNIKHHLEVTNYLIDSLELVNALDDFICAISERRQVYEKKDMSTNKRGNSYHVADYILQFKKNNKKINWHFEIELTLKSRNRYMNGVFPKYINLLNQNSNTQLIYVSPAPFIKRELEAFKNFFIVEKSLGKYEQISEEVFSRLHIFSSEEFKSELTELVNKEFKMKEGI